MGDETAVNRKRKRLAAHGRVLRRGRILARLREGWAYDDIAREEELTAERVRQIVREALAERIVDDETDHAKLQLHRLATAMQIAGMAVADGDVKAIPAFLKVLDRLDRYQRAAKVSQVYDDEARKRLFDKINRVAANLGYDHVRTAADGRERARIRKSQRGMRRRKKKWPGGSAQVIEKARFGEGNPSISLGEIWPGFAGFGSDLARFGSSLARDQAPL